jgi:hypothetical protein
MSKIERFLPNDQYQAAINANAPSAANPFLTEADQNALKHYGSFYDTTSQNGGSIRAFTLNSTDFANGVSIQNNSEITFTALGKFNLAFSAQLIKTGGAATNIWIWLRHNGVDVPDSATVLEMGNNNQYLVAAWNFFINVNTNPQHFELMWYTPSANVSIGAIADASTPVGVPAVPSLIVTVNQVG